MVKVPIEKQAVTIIKSYTGNNDYINYYKRCFEVNPYYSITKKLAKYVLEHHQTVAKEINQWVDIHPYTGKQLQTYFKTKETPTRIHIYKVLNVKKNDTIHIWGRLFETDKYFYSIKTTPSAFLKTRDVGEIDWTKYERPPLPHQIPAVETLIKYPKFILADDMGLGKTGSAIMAAMELGFEKILVICTATLKLNWQKEISFYDDKKSISVVNGNNWQYNKWVIVNYDILRNFHHLPQRGVKSSDLPLTAIQISNFDLVIIDEAHSLKDASSQRSKIVNNFIFDIPNRWLLTGTPIGNKPIDYFNLLQICDSPVADNWMTYVKTYCKGKQFTNRATKKKYWSVGGHSNLDELRIFTKDLVLRRMKSEITDLPEKIIQPIYLPLVSTVLYEQYIQEYKEWLTNIKIKGEKPPIGEHLTHLIKIRQLLSLDKIDTTIALANTFIEEGKKVVIFTCFTESLDYLMDSFGDKAVRLDGSMSTHHRQQSVDAFQNTKKIKVFCGNIIAGGVGITLTAGEIVIFNDLDWVPTNHVQAEDRCLRIGQKNNINVFYPLFDETLDVDMFNGLTEKKKVINTILGDIDTNFEETMVKYVSKRLKHQLLGGGD